MFRIFFSSLVGLLFIANASGQTIYEPVQYQYVTGGDIYYYGGRDAAVLARADNMSALNQASQSYGQGNVDIHRDQLVASPRIYSDAFPFRDPAPFGFAAGDAKNEAYTNVPRYFRKSDLLAAGVHESTTLLIVPAQAVPLAPTVSLPSQNTSTTAPIVIIPVHPAEKRDVSDNAPRIIIFH